MRLPVQSAKQGLYHIPWLRETWNKAFHWNKPTFEGTDMESFSEIILLLFIACNLSCLEQVRVFIFLNSSHWANVQCLLKRKRLHTWCLSSASLLICSNRNCTCNCTIWRNRRRRQNPIKRRTATLRRRKKKSIVEWFNPMAKLVVKKATSIDHDWSDRVL